MADGDSLRQQVIHRAGNRCEYCRLPAEYTSTPFQLDHVIAEKHAGKTTLENLAWSCLHCNAFKGPNIAGRLEDSGAIVPLFNPRQDAWEAHFEWDGVMLRGTTPMGRVTVEVLRINLAYRVAVRSSLVAEGVFPY